MRAVLFAMATVVRRFDLLARSDLTHAPVADGFVSALRMTDVAPVIIPFLSGPVPGLHAASFSFMAGVIPPMPMFGRWLL